MKRFTETSKWDDPWFRKLPLKYKNLWQYIADKCDNAGIWVKDIETASYFIGEKIDEKEALSLFNSEKERVIIHKNDKWEIIDFIEFQFGKLKDNNPLHKSILSIIERHKSRGIAGVFKGYLNPSGKGKGKGRGKGKGEGKGEKNNIYPSDEEFIISLKNNSAYKHIDIISELGKMDAWLSARPGRQKTRRFIVNWLNKIEKPLKEGYGRNGKTVRGHTKSGGKFEGLETEV